MRVAALSSVVALGLLSGCAFGANDELRARVDEAAPPGTSLDCEWGSSSYESDPKSWVGCWTYVPGEPESWLAR